MTVARSLEPSPSMPSATFRALGTTAHVVTVDAGALCDARYAVECELAAIDSACSRFRADSELVAVNASCGRWVEVGELLLEALAAALRAASATGGLVDPTVGKSLGALGYQSDFGLVARISTADVVAVPAGRWSEIEIDQGRTRVRVPLGVQLDLGATAKALAADRAAAAAARTGDGALVGLGGDISVAGATPADGWAVRVTDDHRAAFDAPGQTVSIVAGGLATSSTTVRTWQRAGRVLHHIVDPATGSPAVPVWRTASVAASSCLEANVASTAAILQGESAPRWLSERALPARLVRTSGAVETVAHWPDDPADRDRRPGC